LQCGLKAARDDQATHPNEASSSRSEVHRASCRAYLTTGLMRLSVNVRGSPYKDEAIVTQLVTQPGLQARLKALLVRS